MKRAEKLVAGIDIGGTNSVWGLVNREGMIRAEGAISTKQYPDPAIFVDTIYEMIMKAARREGLENDIAGFGIGAPMGNIHKGTIDDPAGLPWKGITPLAELFHRHTPLPVVITNDANAAAVGEMVYGDARGMKNFAVITLGTGLGSGFVIDGRLMLGHDGFAGEMGHVSVKPGISTRRCGCGKTGCLETYVSATGLRRTAMKMMADRLEESELRRLTFDELDARTISDAALKGDIIAIKTFEYTGALLGVKLADLVALINPEAIFLFGGLSLAGELLFAPTREHMEENLLSVYRGRVKLLPSGLNKRNAAVLGAGSLIWSATDGTVNR